MSIMKKLYIITIAAAMLFTGCKKHLDIKPVSFIATETFFKTETDVQGAINGMYARLRPLAELNLFILGEARSEMMTSSIAGTLGYEKYYNNSLTVENAGPDWSQIYSTVNTANLILKYTPDIFFGNESVKKNALAQAYTMRAFLYFVLARTWGGVPIRTEPTEVYDPAKIQMPRSTEAEVFNLIKQDLDQALELFPDNTFTAGRSKWSKASANALKGDVYLWTGKRLNGGTADFTTALSALTAAQTADVILLPNFADIFRYDNKGNREILMAITFRIGESALQVFAHNMYSAMNLP